jgi:AraC-like DNA-binding protein
MASGAPDRTGLKLYKRRLWNAAFEKNWPLYPYAVEETQRDAAIRFSERKSPRTLVVLFLSGELVYQCDDLVEFHLRPGHLALIPAGSDYSFYTTESKNYRKLVLEIRGSLLFASCEALGLGHPIHMPLPPAVFSALERKIRELEGLMASNDKALAPETLSKFHGLLTWLSMLLDEGQAKKSFPVAKAKSLLEIFSLDGDGISSAAKELGLCRASFNRLFKREAGISPLRYVIQSRLEKAQRLLSCSNLPLKEIALRLGYSNQLYFSTAFKKRYGVSPKAFRRKALPMDAD